MTVRGSEVGMAVYLRSRRIIPLLAVLSVVSVLTSCATVRPSDWIRVGGTTRDEVVAEYGEPDLIRVMPEGEVAVYRPTAPTAARPRLSIPLVEAAGDQGAIRTREQPLERGLEAVSRAEAPHYRYAWERTYKPEAERLLKEMARGTVH